MYLNPLVSGLSEDCGEAHCAETVDGPVCYCDEGRAWNASTKTCQGIIPPKHTVGLWDFREVVSTFGTSLKNNLLLVKYP